MNPDEMDYESPGADYDHDEDEYILEIEPTTDAEEGDGDENDDDIGIEDPEEEEEESEEDLSDYRVAILGLLRGQHSRLRQNLVKGAEPVPSPEGQNLMLDVRFGCKEWRSYPSRPNPTHKPLPQHIRLLEREIGAYRCERARAGNQLLAQHLLPSTKADFVMHYDARCYSGQFSQDGNFFYSCSQDFRVHMYDTSNPYKWHHYKTVIYPGGQWTITDATLSPDNKMLAYSSIASTVYATNTTSEMDETIALDFASTTRHNRNAMQRHFGIWSIRFSGDGREMVAGANDHNLYVYDIESQTSVLKLTGHQDDVNAVCFADESSPHILFSGSDDTTLKVWDRRSMEYGKAVGVFCGHLEGLTYIDTKGDGRYVLSNGKDQTMKLWDIRKMMDPNEFNDLKCYNYSSGFDYRSGKYDYPPARHPQDSSLVTYRGHSVLSTLIRCHFSPPTSSGSRYVYSGSSDGKVFIYNLDATTASVIDVNQATHHTRPWRRELIYDFVGWGTNGTRWKTCVRDASWHPNAGIIAATGWNGYGGCSGTVTLHSWGGAAGGEEEEGGRPVRLDRWAKKDQTLYRDDSEEEATDREEQRERDIARLLRRRYL